MPTPGPSYGQQGHTSFAICFGHLLFLSFRVKKPKLPWSAVFYMSISKTTSQSQITILMKQGDTESLSYRFVLVYQLHKTALPLKEQVHKLGVP